MAPAPTNTYVWREGDHTNRHLDVLDTHTGDTLWSKHVLPVMTFSNHGALIALTPTSTQSSNTLTIYDAKDGQQVATLPPHSNLLALSDEGVAYVAGYVPPPCISSAQLFSGQSATLPPRHKPIPMISAVRLSDGAELWRAENIEPGYTVITTDDVLYAVRLTQPQQQGEVTALDIHTGQLLWRWHTPGNILSLLRLWQTRTPYVLLHAIAQIPRSITRARDSHNQSIIHHELINGQWRRPAHLLSNIHVAASDTAVYVVTSLGLFALHPRNGHLLWHALPTSDLVEVVASPTPS